MAEIARRRPADVLTFRKSDYDLARQEAVSQMYRDLRPNVVVHLAAQVGGIGANLDNPGRFFYENAIMGIELLEQARLNAVDKFVQVGTICSYPKLAPLPFQEDDLWNGYPEESNAPYGIAKKALLVMAQGYRKQYGTNAIFLMPANLYGPGDNFDPRSSHVIPALIRKCVEARETEAPAISVWGTGAETREFLYVEDAARGIVLATELYDKGDPVNLGTQNEISIRELVRQVMRLTGYEGRVEWDTTKPGGQPRRKVSTERAFREFGFRAVTPFEDGLRTTIAWYESNRRGSATASGSPSPTASA